LQQKNFMGTNKEQKFYKTLQDIFIGAKIEGEGGFINLMRIKSKYYEKIEQLLKKDIEETLKKYPGFREELFDKLYTFFSRYFTESGSIYFNSTPFHNNVYEKVYTNDRDVILFWKTHMLYYVKTDRIFKSIPVEFDGYKFYFDATTIENKKANERRNLIYEIKEIKEDKTIVFNVYYSEKGRVTKTEDILKGLKKKGINISDEELERAFRVFERQSEVDFFINKNAKAFLQEQFKLWSYQYFWEGAKEWDADRVNQLQILKDIAFKIIDFVSQFEDELVKIWNKPKFVKNSNYVITLDRLNDDIIEKIIYHRNLDEQIEEWKQIGIVDEEFEIEHIFENFSNKSNEYVLNLFSKEELRKQGLISTGYHLPYNPDLVERAKELRKNMTPAEKKLWYEYLRNFKHRVLRQRPINHFIVDFYCPALKLVIEIDGKHHFTEEGKSYDEERRKILERYGLREIRFRNDEVINEFDRVCKEIERIPPASPLIKGGIKGGIKKEFSHLPIDTKYFKDLEFEILSQFEDLDNSLDGWLIKSENYQALNTILPKFKEKVQTIYIDPPFNLDSSDQFLYRTNYKDANWATLLENRLRIAREWLNEKGSIFVRCDYNGNWIVRCLLDEIFGKENFRNEISVSRGTVPKGETGKMETSYDTLLFYAKGENNHFVCPQKKRDEVKWQQMHLPQERATYELQVRYFSGIAITPSERKTLGIITRKN
jgi:very-short-patch-repair endonuclease